MKNFSLVASAFILLNSVSAHAESDLAFDTALGFTSNGDLSAVDGVSDRIWTLGGVSRFWLDQSRAKASLKYTEYGKLHENDLLSAEFGSSWNSKDKNSHGPAASLKAVLRDYLHDAPASTDKGFTHYGVIGDLAWNKAISDASYWMFSPRAEVEHFPSYFNRSDLELAVLFEHSTSLTPDSNFSFGATPTVLFSTLSDFSKLSLVLSADYDGNLDEDLSWGASAFLIPGVYTSRNTAATQTIVVRSKKGRASTISTSAAGEKESTLSLSPSVWIAKELMDAFEVRLESGLNFQTSKSGSYDYSEFQTFLSVHYQVF